MMNVLFRAAADAIFSLTVGDPLPKGRKSLKWLKDKKKQKPYQPGIIAVSHTFGGDLKWNPHLHIIVTGGGLSIDGKRWIKAPSRYLVPGPLLGTEWKLNVINAINKAHRTKKLYCRRLRKDRRRRLKVDLLLGHIRKKRWHILIGPSLRSAEKAVRYACRYTKRPVIAEGRITKFDAGYVTFRFKDYHRAGAPSFKKLPVLTFIDRLVQHIPDLHFRQVRHYGLFSTAKRRATLARSRQLLAQRKKRRPSASTWEKMRKAAGDRKPLSCPRCGHAMFLYGLMFGSHISIAELARVKTNEKIQTKTTLKKSSITSSSVKILAV
jgi:hypothetical protein